MVSAARWTDRLSAVSGAHWFMVIFYGDESGTHGQGDYVISGYVAHETTWNIFTDNWRRFLDAELPHKIRYLKMAIIYLPNPGLGGRLELALGRSGQ